MTPNDDIEVLAAIRTIFEERIPFNQSLGLTIETLDEGRASLRLPMRDELIGNYYRRSLHGGVISATLDVTGGLVAFLAVARSMRGRPLKEQTERFSNLGTIDLRVDFLRPGLGGFFLSSGFILRLGHRVAVTRMELRNDEETLIAVGTGAYLVA